LPGFGVHLCDLQRWPGVGGQRSPWNLDGAWVRNGVAEKLGVAGFFRSNIGCGWLGLAVEERLTFGTLGHERIS
jgi:hypothetical protein